MLYLRGSVAFNLQSCRGLTTASRMYQPFCEFGAIILQTTGVVSRDEPRCNKDCTPVSCNRHLCKPRTYDRGRLDIRVEVVVDVGMVERGRNAQQEYN